jgi:predicted nucleic-acid-binding Zn-ribbon protein
MQLNEKQCKALLTKLQSFGPVRPCEVCGATAWSVCDQITEAKGFSSDAAVWAVPFVLIACSKCGYTRFLNAVVLGVVNAATGHLIEA